MNELSMLLIEYISDYFVTVIHAIFYITGGNLLATKL